MSDRTLKVVLLGNLGVGKTCLRSQFVHHMFTNAYKATIGGDYLTSRVVLPSSESGHETHAKASLEAGNSGSTGQGSTRDQTTNDTAVNLQIWDTAGQERFNLISQAFYRGADIAVLVYDVTNYESVVAINGWFTRFMEHCHVDRPGVIIVANKIDKPVVITREEVYRLLEHESAHTGGPCVLDYISQDGDAGGVPYEAIIEVSSKKLELVQKVFERAARIGVVSATAVDNPRLVGFDIDVAAPPVNSKCC